MHVQLVRGSIDINGTRFNEGDGARVCKETRLTLFQGQQADVLVIDLRSRELPAMQGRRLPPHRAGKVELPRARVPGDTLGERA